MGRQVRMSGPDRAWMTVVGIVSDVKQDSLDARSQPEIYMPHSQFRPFWQDSTLRDFTLVIRTSGEPTALAGTARRHVADLDPNLPIAMVTTLEHVVADSVAGRRLNLLLFGTFAGIALLLAAVGTYGVLAYQTSERLREFAVRLALGATPRSILATVLRQGMLPAFAGVVAGFGIAAVLTRTMASLLFEIAPFHPPTFAAVAALLLLAALAACYVPARRALRVDPGMTLRAE
jgi:putative ABC transport system permease protein